VDIPKCSFTSELEDLKAVCCKKIVMLLKFIPSGLLFTLAKESYLLEILR
jgi:hypothetical protein